MKRRALVYTLPPIILIAFLILIGMAAWHRSHMIANLASTLAHGEKDAAQAAARKLAAISNPPLELLVNVATSDDNTRAEAAQAALGRVLDNLEKDSVAGRRPRSVSAQAAELAAALAKHRHAFSRASHPWLTDSTRRILSIANRCPTKSPFIALHCDDVVSVVKLARPVASPVAEHSVTPELMVGVPERESQRAGLEREFASYAAEPIVSPIPKAPVSAPGNTISEPASVVAPAELTSVDAPSPQIPPAAIATNNRPSWSEPVMRLQLASPVQSNSQYSIKQNDDDDAAAKPATLSEQPPDTTRELLDRWRTSRSDRLEIEDELATRGFRPIPKRLVEQYFSENLTDRLRLVDSVLTEPNVDARPWLMLFAEDENAEVRLMAVTVMATSDDNTLVEKAWLTAIRDRDSRIADLAARLRARRDGATRR